MPTLKKVLSFRPGVSHNIALHASSLARNICVSNICIRSPSLLFPFVVVVVVVLFFVFVFCCFVVCLLLFCCRFVYLFCFVFKHKSGVCQNIFMREINFALI